MKTNAFYGIIKISLQTGKQINSSYGGWQSGEHLCSCWFIALPLELNVIHTTTRKIVLGLIICIAVLYSITGSTASAQEPQNTKILQPQGLELAGIYPLKKIDPNLTGEGVRFAVICRSITYIDDEPQNDYRPDIEHNCFNSSILFLHDQGQPPAGISPHSTAICSILLGEDPNAFYPPIGQFYFQGIAPQAQADIYEFWYFLTNNIFEHLPPDADIITIDNGIQFEDWWTNGIDSLAENYGLTIVAAIGNGTDAYDPVLYPGAGANIIGVGVIDSVDTKDIATNLEHFALAYPEHSTFGPTPDERCKPDIVAPGNCLAAIENKPNVYEPTGNWSSFSTQIVAGTIGLLVQKAKQDPNLSPAISPDAGNCVIKAILLNSAVKLPFWHKGRLQTDDDHTVPLDYIQGAGMLNAVGAYRHLTSGLNEPGDVSPTGWDLNQLYSSSGLENVYKITLAEPADKFITTTVVWNKHFERTYPFEPAPEKDSNLRLEVWAVDPNNHGNDYLLDYSDSIVDNIEHIYIPADPNYSNYEIILSMNKNDDPREIAIAQSYGLAWNISDKQDTDSIFWYDLNADGIVNESDFAILLNNILNSTKSPDGYLLGDINADGAIDIKDFNILIEHNNRRADWYIKPEDKLK